METFRILFCCNERSMGRFNYIKLLFIWGQIIKIWFKFYQAKIIWILHQRFFIFKKFCSQTINYNVWKISHPHWIWGQRGSEGALWESEKKNESNNQWLQFMTKLLIIKSKYSYILIEFFVPRAKSGTLRAPDRVLWPRRSLGLCKLLILADARALSFTILPLNV